MRGVQDAVARGDDGAKHAALDAEARQVLVPHLPPVRGQIPPHQVDVAVVAHGHAVQVPRRGGREGPVPGGQVPRQGARVGRAPGHDLPVPRGPGLQVDPGPGPAARGVVELAVAVDVACVGGHVALGHALQGAVVPDPDDRLVLEPVDEVVEGVEDYGADSGGGAADAGGQGFSLARLEVDAEEEAVLDEEGVCGAVEGD